MHHTLFIETYTKIVRKFVEPLTAANIIPPMEIAVFGTAGMQPVRSNTLRKFLRTRVSRKGYGMVCGYSG